MHEQFNVPNKRNQTMVTKVNGEYSILLTTLKEKIRNAQVKAALSVNSELIQLYWEMGKEIAIKQENEGWGKKTIEQLAKDLKISFPNKSGFSTRNLSYMKQLAISYPSLSILQQAAAKIPWGHNMVLIDKLDNIDERIWYAKKTIENGWSRNSLEMWIESGLYQRQGQAITNFSTALPPSESDLVKAELKDSYCFEFLSIDEQCNELEIESKLVEQIQKFLMELGAGFAFIGRQYKLEVGGDDFFIDLLFYHYKLKRFVIVELKTGPFKPEYVSKVGFYLSAIDAQLKQLNDEPSIGMILCKNKNRLVVEYTLKNSNQPIGVASYTTKIADRLTNDMKSLLPTSEEIELGIQP